VLELLLILYLLDQCPGNPEAPQIVRWGTGENRGRQHLRCLKQILVSIGRGDDGASELWVTLGTGKVTGDGGHFVDFHLERGLQLHTEPEYKSLYQWAIIEVDAQGQKIGGDQIPWEWTLNFTATSCVLGDNLDIRSELPIADTTPAAPKVVKDQALRIQLRPGSPQDDGNYHRQTTFSMFGTARPIKNFQLDIYPIADPPEPERCGAWGSISYTTDVDFRDETSNDCIVFTLFVTPESFAHYSAKVSHGFVDDMVFSVGSVDGFYSEWSPSISTRNVKVLTGYDEQKITAPPDLQFQPPRLGYVGAAKLYINRRLEFAKPTTEEHEAAKEPADIVTERAAPRAPALAVGDSRMLQTLRSLRRAAWFVVCLLTLIFIAIVLRH
jgi:hypothetical protein